MPFVLDASVTMAWCFEDETNPFTEAVLDRLTETHAVVPTIWQLEIANVLLVGERKQRLTQAKTSHFITLLQSLPINVAETAETFPSLLALGREHKLSSYDASYLALALMEGLPLASQDSKLRNAAAQLGVTLLE